MKLSDSTILNFIRRVLWLALSIVNWAVYVPTFFIVFALEIVFIAFCGPIIWLFIGNEKTETIFEFLFIHSNSKLWYVEPWKRGGRGKFESIVPIHGKFIQEYIDMILPDNDFVEFD
jgi:hypothetical protein